ncbi:DUF4124 domain-containing protein [Shewanella sp.]|uniref:DUF4124 domain-containing protein n=1 Tax=Shewanella sp. TaxID=50422 RepID=UPI003566C741
MESRYPVLLVSLLLVSGMAGASTIYKWVDKNGVTHYSEQPPADETQTQTLDAKQIEPKRMGFDSPKPRSKSEDEPISDEQKNANLIRQQNADQADAICEQARQNVDVLTSYSRVTQKDPTTNETVEMSDSEREKVLAEANKRIKLFCKDQKN